MKLFIIVCILVFTKADAIRSVCYYSNLAQYRSGKGKMMPERINPNLCTHIMYAYAKPVGLELKPIEDTDDTTPWSEGMYSRVVKRKLINPNVKMLLSVGGKRVGSKPFIPVVQTSESRSTFTRNVILFLRKRKFDGLEMAWEYPTTRGSTPEDKPKLQLLMEELMSEFKLEESQTGKTRLMLTIAVPAVKYLIDNGYFVANLSRTVDFISIMSFDFQGVSNKSVSFNFPLYAHPDESEPAAQLTVDWAARYFVSLGAPKELLNIGFSTYGRSFTLKDPKHHSILSAAFGKGKPGTYSKEAGILSYYEICDMAAQGGQTVREASQKNPYVVKGNQWVGYEDIDSVKAMACYISQQGYGGILIWTIDFDDFLGTSCKQGEFPLLTAAFNTMINSSKVCEPHTTSPEESSTEATLPGNEVVMTDQPLTEVVVTTSPPPDTFRFVCYFSNRAQYRPGNAQFLPEHIDPELCTHIMYTYSKPVGLDLHPLEYNDDDSPWSEGMYNRVLKVKSKNPRIKVILSAGGYSMGSEPFIPLVQTEASRKTFADNIVLFLRRRKFDGFDVDWEYPTFRGSNSSDKQNFQLFMEEMKRTFENESDVTGKPRLLLTVAVPAGKSIIDNGFEMVKLASVVDFMSIFTFAFHGSWEKFLGFNSPLYAYPTEKGEMRNLNVDWVARYYVSLGVAKRKLNIAIATYGRSFKLVQSFDHSIYSPAKGAGMPYPYTREPGKMAYYEVCTFIFNESAKVINVPSQGNRYAFKDTHWVGYDDIESVKQKACYARINKFGGILFHSMDLDDFTGYYCNQGKFPLIRAAVQEASSLKCTQEKMKSTSRGYNLVSNKVYLSLFVVLAILFNTN